jgi:Flp pilus assembly protein TadG
MTRRDDREQGQAMLLVVIMSLVLLALAALVYSSGRIISARQDGVATAEEAARAGSQALAVSTRAGGPVALDGPAAIRAAQAYLAASPDHYQGTVTVTGTTVTVTVSRQLQLGGIANLIGLGGPTVTATGRSQPLQGVRTQIP